MHLMLAMLKGGRHVLSSEIDRAALEKEIFARTVRDAKASLGERLKSRITDRKYCIGIEEAARYYGIGTKKLRQIIAEHPTDNFYLEIARRVLLKRKQFEAWLDDATAL